MLLCQPRRPGACIIKLITDIIYSFCNKLECLSLASLSSLVQCLGTNTVAYNGTVNYSLNKFNDTGPRGLYYKLYRFVIYKNSPIFIANQCLFYCQSQIHELGQTHQLTTESIDYESVMFFLNYRPQGKYIHGHCHKHCLYR